MTIKITPKHVPDKRRIPMVLYSLPWNELTEDYGWTDGEVLLVAVPVCKTDNYRRLVDPLKDWHYEFSVLTVHCDEGLFELNLDGEPWGWDYLDIDWFARIRK